MVLHYTTSGVHEQTRGAHVVKLSCTARQNSPVFQRAIHWSPRKKSERLKLLQTVSWYVRTLKLAIYNLYLTWFCNVHVCWSLSFKIPDNYEGYSLEHFCVPGHYIADLRHVMIPKGLHNGQVSPCNVNRRNLNYSVCWFWEGTYNWCTHKAHVL